MRLARSSPLLIAVFLAACAPGPEAPDDVDASLALAGEVSLWPASTVPARPADADTAAVELGVKFKATSAGQISGLRFFKGRGNTGTHVGHLWSASGARLAEVTFRGETATGWQVARFAAPVTIAANELYVASYHAPRGHYAGDNGYFSSARVAGPLTAPRSVDVGGNGVYRYGAAGFPSQSWNASNYYVDVLFVPDSSTPPPPPPTGGDTTAPTAPSALTAAAVSTSQIDLTWAAATDAVGVTGYRVFRGATQVGTTTATRFSDAGLTAATAYSYAVRATDAAGNVGPSSPAATATTLSASPAPNGCASAPSRCGYPDATNTGVPAGVVLRKVPAEISSGQGWSWDSRGFMRVDGAGAIVDGVEVVGEIYVTAPNAVVRRSRVTNTGSSSMGVSVRPGADNVTVEDLEITGPDAASRRLMVGVKAWGVRGLVVRRVEVTHAATGIQTDVGQVEDCFVHSMGFIEGDHLNGFTSNAYGGGLTLRHNTFFNEASQTDAVSLFQDFGIQKDALITDNLLGGGGYTIYGGDGRFGLSSNIRITNNRITRHLFPQGGFFGWLAHVDSGAGNVVSGNVWDDTGALIR